MSRWSTGFARDSTLASCHAREASTPGYAARQATRCRHDLPVGVTSRLAEAADLHNRGFVTRAVDPPCRSRWRSWQGRHAAAVVRVPRRPGNDHRTSSTTERNSTLAARSLALHPWRRTGSGASMAAGQGTGHGIRGPHRP